MPRKQFYDVPEGDLITYDVVTENGYRLFPGFQPTGEDAQTNFDSIPLKKCRPDDILLNSYPKTGTNWLWEMLRLITRRTSTVSDNIKISSMLEARPEKFQDEISSPRVLNTHVKYNTIPKEAVSKKIRCIFICRNPKDVVVSFYNHTKGIGGYQYDGKFENYLQMFMRGEVDHGSYPEYLLEWQNAIRDNPDWPIHVVYYEDLKDDTFGELRKLCDYLKEPIEDELLRKIIESCQIDNMRKSKVDNIAEENKQFLLPMKNNYSFMRKGEIGDWKNWFTVAQNEIFEKWWEAKTKGLDMFKFRYVSSKNI